MLSDRLLGRVHKGDEAEQSSQTEIAFRDEMSNGGRNGETLPAPFVTSEVVDFYLNTGDSCPEGEVLGLKRYWRVNPEDGWSREWLYDAYECVPWSEVNDSGLAAPPPDDALVTEAVQDAVAKRLPAPGIEVDPDPEGLTGLATHLWYDAPPQVRPLDHDGDPTTPPILGLEVTAAAGPYTITARAGVVEYRWHMGDGTVLRSTTPGTSEDPAASHIYETKGDYTIVLEMVWTGSYTWQAGETTGTGTLGTVTLTGERAYLVHEVRAVLTG